MKKIWPLDYYINETRVPWEGQEEKKLRFTSFSAIFQAAYDMIAFYESLNTNALCYLGSPKEEFQFDMETGHMIQLNDSRNIQPMPVQVRAFEIQNEYSAPELILEHCLYYNTDSQNWTLAVLLYELLFHTESPLKGYDTCSKVFLTPQEELKYMAEKGMFNMGEEENDQNQPVHGIQDTLINYWRIYPACLQKAFQEVFGEGKEDVTKRKTPSQWRNVLVRTEKEYLSCACGVSKFAKNFLDEKELIRCPKCGSVYRILASGDRRIYLSNGTEIDACQLYASEDTPSFVAAQVVENKNRKGVFGIKNMTNQDWKGLFPNGEERPIKPGGGIPLWAGLTMEIDDGTVWKIKGDS